MCLQNTRSSDVLSLTLSGVKFNTTRLVYYKCSGEKSYINVFVELIFGEVSKNTKSLDIGKLKENAVCVILYRESANKTTENNK